MVPRARPLPIREPVVCLDNRDSFVTESFFSPKVEPNELVDFLKEEGTTGQLFVDLTQGAIQSIRLTEKKKLEDTEADTVREFLGLDPEEEEK